MKFTVNYFHLFTPVPWALVTLTLSQTSLFTSARVEQYRQLVVATSSTILEKNGRRNGKFYDAISMCRCSLLLRHRKNFMCWWYSSILPLMRCYCELPLMKVITKCKADVLRSCIFFFFNSKNVWYSISLTLQTLYRLIMQFKMYMFKYYVSI